MFSAVDIKEAVLGVFSQIDRPLSPGGKAVREFRYLLQGWSPEARQLFRERILAVDAARLAHVARTYLVDGWDAGAVSVVAGEDMLLEANSRLGTAALALEKV
jgi:Zn-dependent M16 (insulinase) family peptidase